MLALEPLDATILQLQPRDMVVLKVKHRLTAEDARRMRNRWHEVTRGTVAEGVPVAILDSHTDIAILRKSAAA